MRISQSFMYIFMYTHTHTHTHTRKRKFLFFTIIEKSDAKFLSIVEITEFYIDNVERKRERELSHATRKIIFEGTLHLTVYSSLNPERDAAHDAFCCIPPALRTDPLFAYIV